MAQLPVDDPWIASHSPIDPAKLHAMGYLTVAWNSCDYWLNVLFSVALGASEAVARAISHEMGDVTLLNRMRDVARVRGLDENALELLDHVAAFADRCRSNRNQLSHFKLNEGANGLRLIRNKGPNLGGELLNDTIDEIRRVGEDADRLRAYVRETALHLFTAQGLGRPLRPSPGKPPLPELFWKPPKGAKPP